jgi:hypothetical protein
VISLRLLAPDGLDVDKDARPDGLHDHWFVQQSLDLPALPLEALRGGGRRRELAADEDNP